MIMRNILRRIGGPAVLFGALAVAPLTASAMAAKQSPITPAEGTQVASQAGPSSNGEVLVGRAGYVHIKTNRSESQLQTASNGHSSDLKLVPKVGYVDVKMAS